MPRRFEVGTFGPDGTAWNVVHSTDSYAEAKAMAKSPTGQFWLYDRYSDLFEIDPRRKAATK